MLGHKTSLNIFKKTGIIQNMFSHQNEIKLEINNQIFRKKPSIWKLSNTFLAVKLENTLKDIKIFDWVKQFLKRNIQP